MKKDIQNFPEQLRFRPQIENKEKWGEFHNYFLFGMGGSHLQGDVLKAISPCFPLSLHRNYGLPCLCNDKKAGFIAASYSGNTEEVLDAYSKALAEKLPVAAISKGGKLLKRAKEEKIPFIELPENNIEPRMAIGYSYKALLEFLGLEKEKKEAESAASNLEDVNPSLEEEAKEIISLLKGRIPVLYASERNATLVSMWKINFNETTKIPSFYNILPELNHNEMAGFDRIDTTSELSEKMIFILLKDADDHKRVEKRREILMEILEEKGLETIEIEVEGDSRTEKVFRSILLSEWIAYYLGDYYGVNYENSVLIEKFKKMIK